MIRVLRFDRSVYEAIERDPAAIRQGARVVGVVAAAAALGTALAGAWHPGAVLGAVLAALVHWMLWGGVDHLIGALLFRRRSSLARSLGALGYAQTPQLLALFAFVPTAGSWIVIGSRVLAMLAGNQALGTCLAISRRQAIAVRLASFAIAAAVAALVRAVLGDVPFATAVLRP